MKQSRLMSLVESLTNVLVGYGIAVVTQILIFPWFGLHVTLAQNMAMGGVFTVISIARSFALRRAFEAVRVRRGERQSVFRAEASVHQHCEEEAGKDKDHGGSQAAADAAQTGQGHGAAASDEPGRAEAGGGDPAAARSP